MPILTDQQQVSISRRLSWGLRHRPEEAGLVLDSAGWCSVHSLLLAFNLTERELREVVEQNSKKRFELSDDGTRIRASQGHSVEVDLEYEPKTPPEFLWHGTFLQALPEIWIYGLSRMRRHHVHLSASYETALATARRRAGPLVLIVRAGELAERGHVFFCSTNGVWLTESVPSEFLRPHLTTGR